MFEGLLLSYINCCGATLHCIDRLDPKYSKLWQKWDDQISHTLECLHSHDIIRGDAKAANVLVDVNEDAYLIDLGGGYPQGWVGKEVANSIDADLQGLERIKQHLFEWVLRELIFPDSSCSLLFVPILSWIFVGSPQKF